MNKPRPLVLRRWVFFGAMAALAAVALGFTVLFQLHHRAEEIEAQFDAAALNARAFEDHLSQSFNAIDLSLVNAADSDPAQVTPAGASKALVAALRVAPFLRSLALLDAHGTIVASSNPRNLGRTVALGGFLPPQRNGAPALRVGSPWIGRDFADGRPGNPGQPARAESATFLPVAREVVLDDGRRVTMLAAVNSDFLVNHYGRALNTQSGTVDLLRDDGTLLLSTDTTRRPGAREGADALRARMTQSPLGRYEQRLAGGRVVSTAYQASGAYPLAIVVQLDQEQALAPWRKEATGSLTLMVALLLAAMALATGYYFRLERAARLRAEAEAAVRVSEAHHRNTFETAAVGIAHASPEGRLLRCNPHLCEMLGYTAQELTQKTIGEITHPDDLAEDRAWKQRLLSGKVPSYRFEKRYLHRSSEPVWVRVTVNLARDAAGRIEYMPAIVENIHLRKLTHVALEALNTDLTGEAFLRQMTRTLAELLGVEFALIGEALPSSTGRFTTRALWVDDGFAPDFTYDLAGTPCETVTRNTLRVYAAQVQQRFPGDELLVTMGIESYAAVPLGTTAEGAPTGVLAIMSRHPLRNIEAVQMLLPLLALRVGAELAREREARKFRDLFEFAPDALVMANCAGAIVQVNRQAEALFGWTRADLLGHPVEVLMPIPARAGHVGLRQGFVKSAVPRAMGAGQSNLRGMRKDGTTFAMHVSLGPLQAGDDLVVVAAVRDTTEHEQMHEAVRQSAALYRHTLDHMLEGCQIIDLDWRVRYVNAAAARQNRQPAQALMGRTMMEAYPGFEATEIFATMRRCMEDRIGQHSETEWVFADGTRGWFEVSVMPAPEGILVFSVETTERKRAEQEVRAINADLERRVVARTTELSRAREHAEQANRAKSAFLATMSHEIRTPMNGVVGMIDVLEQSSLRSSQAEIVKTIRESAHALLTIVDDVLDFSKIEAGQFQIESEPIGVAGVVEMVCDTLDPLAGRRGVELTLFTDPAIPARVLGDAARLRQVLLNLAGNAIKFSSGEGRAGRVSVRAGVVESGMQQVVLEFSVADNGIGMDEDTQSRLFSPFTQADAGTTRRYGGTGLGLSISHRLVDMMGGTIGVCSEPGRGSTFTVRLPLTALAAELRFDDAQFDLAGLNCLVLGGPQGPADDLAVYLTHSGAAVHRVAHQAAALQWFGSCAPGLWVGVVVGADRAQDEPLADLRRVCAAQPNLDARFVVIEHGRRRRPRVRAHDHVSLDHDAMHRSDFVKAVALAAGRSAEEALEEPSFTADTAPAPLSVQEARAQGQMILVAEDNEINQKVLVEQLALLGLTARIAGNGSEALAFWQRGDYAMLFTDLHMPQMDGYELVAAIREAEAGQRRMPIVALTANALKGEARRCRDLGMDDYMTKPLQLADLMATLRKWLPATRNVATPSVPPSEAAARALDVSVLEALVGNEPAVIGEVLRDFRISAGKATALMRVACRARQAGDVEAIAHKLKSSARAVGALALGELCARMEEAGHAGRLETLAVLWPRFEAEMAAVDQLLDSSNP